MNTNCKVASELLRVARNLMAIESEKPRVGQKYTNSIGEEVKVIGVQPDYVVFQRKNYNTYKVDLEDIDKGHKKVK